MSDLLSDILSGLRFRASSYFCSEFSGDWGISSGGLPQGEFHILLNGQAWVMLSDSPPRQIRAGDIILVPHGSAHRIAAAPELTTVDGATLVAELRQGHNRFASGDRAMNSAMNEQSAATLLCGNFQYNSRIHPLLQALPELIHLQAGGSILLAGLQHLISGLAHELQQHPQGAALIRDRLTEVLIIQLLRLYIEDSPQLPFLAAFHDRLICQALTLMHEQLAEPWTVESLARAVGMSRSAFSARFTLLAGDAPMNYLLHWRMQQAALLLEQNEKPVAIIAEQVGYSSEPAFRKAFRRVLGVPPGQFSRAGKLSYGR
ncbi:MAG: AraC family transcriptional regulator [Marinobacterium sp.]|nr:AraC family transcriptional regulator [Marinobacterium sp.]